MSQYEPRVCVDLQVRLAPYQTSSSLRSMHYLSCPSRGTTRLAKLKTRWPSWNATRMSNPTWDTNDINELPPTPIDRWRLTRALHPRTNPSNLPPNTRLPPLTPSLINCKRRPLAIGYHFTNLTPWATLAQPDSDRRSYPMIKLSVRVAAARCFLRVVALPDGGKVALGGDEPMRNEDPSRLVITVH